MAAARSLETTIYEAYSPSDDGHWMRVAFHARENELCQRTILFHHEALKDQWGKIIPDMILKKIGSIILHMHSQSWDITRSDLHRFEANHIRKIIRIDMNVYSLVLVRRDGNSVEQTVDLVKAGKMGKHGIADLWTLTRETPIKQCEAEVRIQTEKLAEQLSALNITAMAKKKTYQDGWPYEMYDSSFESLLEKSRQESPLSSSSDAMPVAPLSPVSLGSPYGSPVSPATTPFRSNLFFALNPKEQSSIPSPSHPEPLTSSSSSPISNKKSDIYIKLSAVLRKKGFRFEASISEVLMPPQDCAEIVSIRKLSNILFSKPGSLPTTPYIVTRADIDVWMDGEMNSIFKEIIEGGLLPPRVVQKLALDIVWKLKCFISKNGFKVEEQHQPFAPHEDPTGVVSAQKLLNSLYPKAVMSHTYLTPGTPPPIDDLKITPADLELFMHGELNLIFNQMIENKLLPESMMSRLSFLKPSATGGTAQVVGFTREGVHYRL